MSGCTELTCCLHGARNRRRQLARAAGGPVGPAGTPVPVDEPSERAAFARGGVFVSGSADEVRGVEITLRRGERVVSFTEATGCRPLLKQINQPGYCPRCRATVGCTCQQPDEPHIVRGRE